jgi:hemolysin activation/secretion protein
MIKVSKRSVSLWVILFFALINEAFSQTPSPLLSGGSTDEALRRQEQRSGELLNQLQPKSDVLRAPVEKQESPLIVSESPCFKINDIELAGKDAQYFSWLIEEISSVMYQCVGVKSLNNIAARLDNKLIELGFVTTRTLLPEQNLSQGKLVIAINVGRVSEIKLKEGSDKLIWQNALPIRHGDILNVRDIEQGLEQIQRLSSQTMTTEIAPGNAPDTSQLILQNKNNPKWWQGAVTVDNSGSSGLGRTQFSGYGVIENPLNVNDLFSLSGNINLENPTENHRSYGLSANYSIPWGYNTLSLTAGLNKFGVLVQGTSTSFLSSGESYTNSIKLQRTIWRTEFSKTGVFAGISTRRAASYLNDLELLVQRRRTTNFEMGVTYKQLVDQGSVEFELSQRRGVPWQNAGDDLPREVESDVTLRPTIWLFSGNFNKTTMLFGQSITFDSTWRAQQTSNATTSIDQMSIGGLSSVRGFDGDYVLLAENGFYIRNEIKTPLTMFSAFPLQAYVGLDVGHVWGPSALNLIGTKLVGGAIGVRAQQGNFSLDLALTTPLYKPAGFITPRVYPLLRLSGSF